MKKTFWASFWFDQFIPELNRQEVYSTYFRIMGGEVEYAKYFENPIITAQGEERLIAWNNEPILDPAGNIKGTVSSGEDITERRKAEDDLKESEERYRKIFETVPVGIGVANLEGEVLEANVAMQAVTGYDLPEFKSLNIRNIYVNQKDRDSFLKLLQETGVIMDFEAKLKRKDGTTYYALLNAGQDQKRRARTYTYQYTRYH